MDTHIRYADAGLMIEALPARALVDRFGTPLYAYSASTIRERVARLRTAFADLRPTLCFAVKSCSNLHLLRLLADQGLGMDVVSAGELERAFLAGVPMNRVVFAGTGKTQAELAAALDGRASTLPRDQGLPNPDARGPIAWINVESEPELERIEAVAQDRGVLARCCLRVNPDVDANTHRYTTTGRYENKFGVDITEAVRIFSRFARSRHVFLRGVHCHLGSPIARPEPYVQALWSIVGLLDELQGMSLPVQALNIGGGFGVSYGSPGEDQSPIAPIEDFAARLVPLLRARVEQGLSVLIEPGRWIIAPAGVLLTRIQYVKHTPKKRFAICDAGVHTLIRPALYGSHHALWPIAPATNSNSPHTPASILRPAADAPAGLTPCDVVGPICESSDFLAQQRPLPELAGGDVLAVFSAGAYGMSMASNYNEHPKPAEVLIDGSSARLIRRRQRVLDLLADELAPEVLGAPDPGASR